MKTTFFGYYPPTPNEYERLWKEAIIVLDTNVLLYLYRLPTTARDEFIKLLQLLHDRLWIPYQVALEFQRNRLTVIAAERKSTEDAVESAGTVVKELKRKVEALQIEKRDLGLEVQPLVEDLERANMKLVEAITATHRSQLEIASVDPVRDQLDAIFSGRVGPGPKSQAELDTLTQGGEDRFKDRIPPGFGDADKDKNPHEAIFIHDHFKYQRKFGDLILWRQLIEHAKSTGAKSVLFVTSDNKDDWWWREQGKTIGAHPELVREIRREAGVELFWMYSSAQFTQHANKYTAATVSTESVAELQQVALEESTEPTGPSQSSRTPRYLKTLRLPEIEEGRPFDRFYFRQVEQGVASWLTRIYGTVRFNTRGFPDFIAEHGTDQHGYETIFLRSLDDQSLFSPIIENKAFHGYLELKEGRLTTFTLIVVIRDAEFFDLLDDTDRLSQLNESLTRLLSQYPIPEIAVGSIQNGVFQPLAWHNATIGKLL